MISDEDVIIRVGIVMAIILYACRNLTGFYKLIHLVTPFISAFMMYNYKDWNKVVVDNALVIPTHNMPLVAFILMILTYY